MKERWSDGSSMLHWLAAARAHGLGSVIVRPLRQGGILRRMVPFLD